MPAKHIIHLKRIYLPADKADGYRILVDRIWPRGLKKEDAEIDIWLQNVAPSTALRKWFAHDAEKWKGFVARYNEELKANPALDELKALIKEHKVVTLLYAAKDEEHNNAKVLLQHLK